MLLHHDGVVKLCDAAIAAQPSEEVCWYMAPEVFDGMPDVKSDVWSLGISLIEMAEGKNPFEMCTKETYQYRLKKGDPPSLLSEKWSAAFVDFVSRCLVKDVKERWDVKQLMRVRASLHCKK